MMEEKELLKLFKDIKKLDEVEITVCFSEDETTCQESVLTKDKTTKNKKKIKTIRKVIN